MGRRIGSPCRGTLPSRPERRTEPGEEAVLAVNEKATLPGTREHSAQAHPNALRDLALLLAMGWLVTNLALSIADLPLKYLLKDSLRLNAAAVAAFFALGNFTNYIKPIAGLFTDSVPLLGTRRRHYLLVGVGG